MEKRRAQSRFLVFCIPIIFVLLFTSLGGFAYADDDSYDITIFPRYIEAGTTADFVLGGLPKSTYMNIIVSSDTYVLSSDSYNNPDVPVSTLTSNEGGLAYLTITAPTDPDGRHLIIYFYDADMDTKIGSVTIYETLSPVSYNHKVHSGSLNVRPISLYVDERWPLIPDGLGVGDRFYLMFSTSNLISASTTLEIVYSSFAKKAALNNPALEPFSKWMIPFVHLRNADLAQNTFTTSGFSIDHTRPIYWLGGDRIAQNFADLHDGSWESTERGDIRTEYGIPQQYAKGKEGGNMVSYREHWINIGGTFMYDITHTKVKTFVADPDGDVTWCVGHGPHDKIFNGTAFVCELVKGTWNITTEINRKKISNTLYATYNDLNATGHGTSNGVSTKGNSDVMRPILVITPLFVIEPYTEKEPPVATPILMSAQNAEYTPQNNPPTIIVGSSGTPEVGQEMTIFVSASDVDGDALSYSVDVGFGTLDDTGIFTWTPMQSDVGRHTITFAVSDGTDTVFAPIEITVTGPAPNDANEAPSFYQSNKTISSINEDTTPKRQQNDPVINAEGNMLSITSSTDSIPRNGSTPAIITVSLDAPLEQGQKIKIPIKIQGCGKDMRHCSLSFDEKNSDDSTKRKGDGKKSTLVFWEGAQTITLVLNGADVASKNTNDKDRTVKITLGKIRNIGGASAVMETSTVSVSITNTK